ncbi:hypothetical protein BJX62DRAFT_65326 [Aspergillus germanicus]
MARKSAHFCPAGGTASMFAGSRARSSSPQFKLGVLAPLSTRVSQYLPACLKRPGQTSPPSWVGFCLTGEFSLGLALRFLRLSPLGNPSTSLQGPTRSIPETLTPRRGIIRILVLLPYARSSLQGQCRTKCTECTEWTGQAFPRCSSKRLRLGFFAFAAQSSDKRSIASLRSGEREQSSNSATNVEA